MNRCSGVHTGSGDRRPAGWSAAGTVRRNTGACRTRPHRQRHPRRLGAGELARAWAKLHRRMVDLSGSTTLGIIAGMLHEISEGHTTTALNGVDKAVPKVQYGSYCGHTGILSSSSLPVRVIGRNPTCAST
jgi:hypothetical protein